MAGKQRYSPAKIGTIVDIVHIVIGIVVIIMAVLAISDPSGYMFLFPLIFGLAAILSGVSGWYGVITYRRKPRTRIRIAALFAAAAVLGVIFVISAVSVWGNY